MRSITLLSLLLLLCRAALTAQSTGQTNDEQLVRECFAGYKSAILNDKDSKVVEYVDSQTLRYYQDILDKAQSADSLEVNRMNIMDKLMVFSIRHRASRKDLLKFAGKELFVYSIKEGVVEKNNLENNEVGHVEVEGDFAKGRLVVNGFAAPMHFYLFPFFIFPPSLFIIPCHQNFHFVSLSASLVLYFFFSFFTFLISSSIILFCCRKYRE